MDCFEARNWVLNLFQKDEDNSFTKLSKSERQSGLLVTFLTILVGVLILIFFITADSEANTMLGWMIYYFVFWNLPMQDYKLGLAKRKEKHLLSWIFLCGFHLLFLEAFCIKMICKGLSRRDRFPPLYFLAVLALPLPVLVLSLPVKVYLNMSKSVLERLPNNTTIVVRNSPPVEIPRHRPARTTTESIKKRKKERDEVPPPSYSEVENMDLPSYSELHFIKEDIMGIFQNS